MRWMLTIGAESVWLAKGLQVSLQRVALLGVQLVVRPTKAALTEEGKRPCVTYSRDPCCAGPQHPIECPHEAAVPAALPRRKVLLALFHDGGALSGAVPAEPDGDARLEDFALAAWARYAAVHGYSFLHGDPGCAAGLTTGSQLHCM